MSLLDVRDLTVRIGAKTPVDGVSFAIARGETFALVGESGCGKSMTALALMRLLPNAAQIAGGAVRFADADLLAKTEAEMRAVRGAGVAMIFQEPMTALNPVRTIGDQIGEMFGIHADLPRAEVRRRVLALLEEVRIPDPERAMRAYPHELSGGQRQRAMIAMALALGPKVLIADEPTTALDVTIQAQILQLMRRLRDDSGMGILLITHDLGVVAGMADRVVVMYAGMVMEEAPVRSLYAAPRHPYSRLLLKAIPRVREKAARLNQIAGTTPPATCFPAGCRFNPRCPDAVERCRVETPPLETSADGRKVRCWRADETGLASMAP